MRDQALTYTPLHPHTDPTAPPYASLQLESLNGSSSAAAPDAFLTGEPQPPPPLPLPTAAQLQRLCLAIGGLLDRERLVEVLEDEARLPEGCAVGVALALFGHR